MTSAPRLPPRPSTALASRPRSPRWPRPCVRSAWSGRKNGPPLALVQSRLAGPGLNGRFLNLPIYPTFGSRSAPAIEPNSPAHFLAREASYQAVRSLQIGDRLIPLTGNFTSPTCLPHLAEWAASPSSRRGRLLPRRRRVLLIRSGLYPTFAAHLARLPWAPGAILIQTSTREIITPTAFLVPAQRRSCDQRQPGSIDLRKIDRPTRSPIRLIGKVRQCSFAVRSSANTSSKGHQPIFSLAPVMDDLGSAPRRA